MYSKYETLEPVWQATPATAEKGKAVAKAILDQVLQDIEKML
jgi:creatinine amidohydrolase/Fe(II)-dependent formamide hydrolase-like protein